MKTRPARLDRDGITLLHAHEDGAVVLDIEGAFRVHIAFAPRAFTPAPRAELGVGRGGHGSGLEVVEQMEERVDEHGAGVGQAAAAGKFLLSEPRADARDVAVPVREGAGMINLPKVAMLDGEARGLGLALEAEVLGHHHGAAVLLRGGDNLLGLLGVQGHGLLDEHMLAGIERINGHGRMEKVWQGDGDGVDVRLFQQFFIVRVAARDVKFLRRFAQALGICFGNRHGRGPRAVQKAVEVLDADGTYTDDRATKFFAHKLGWIRARCRTVPDRGQR